MSPEHQDEDCAQNITKATNLLKTSHSPVPSCAEFTKMISGQPFSSFLSPEMQTHMLSIKRLLLAFNSELASIPSTASIESLQTARMEVAKGIFGAVGERTNIIPPFYCQWGCNVFIRTGVYINRDAQLLDNAPITIGSRTIIGPSVTLCTATHPLLPDTPSLSFPNILTRSVPCALPIEIGEDVWLCARVTVNPGVKIGRGSVVASGSVVTADVPEGVLVGGVPARVLRVLAEGEWEGVVRCGDAGIVGGKKDV